MLNIRKFNLKIWITITKLYLIELYLIIQFQLKLINISSNEINHTQFNKDEGLEYMK